MMLDYWKEEIRSRPEKRVSFYEYMAACLYHPTWGYYMQARKKIGKEGDFYTSSSVHSVFAETMMEVAMEISRQNKLPLCFYEMGAGTGLFAKQFLDALKEKYPTDYEQAKYILIEKSMIHQKEQQALLHEHKSKVYWLDSLSEQAATDQTLTRRELENNRGIFFSNELVDAFPVYLVEKRDGTLMEVGVTWNEIEGNLQETVYPLEREEVFNYLERLGIPLQEGQRLEVPVDALSWVEEVNGFLSEGVWLTIDYGYTNAELTLPQYRRGSLRCYDHHQMDDNPYLKPGKKDITYHIHFDVIRDRAVELGWENLGLYRQSDFLLRSGILNMLEEHQSSNPFDQGALKKNRAIRQFISPEGMSSSFHVLVLAKGIFAQSKHTYSFMRPFTIDTFIPR